MKVKLRPLIRVTGSSLLATTDRPTKGGGESERCLSGSQLGSKHRDGASGKAVAGKTAQSVLYRVRLNAFSATLFRRDHIVGISAGRIDRWHRQAHPSF